MDAKKVLITGFGPYREIKINPSWEAVDIMNKEEIESKYNISLHKEKINVFYGEVDENLPKLWKKIQPDLTIHVGVQGDSCFTIETQACKKGYVECDSNGKCPEENTHKFDGPDTIVTDLNVDELCQEFNNASDEIKAKTSDDAGKFLCEYTYYAGLYHGSVDSSCSSCKTLFVHVPLFGYDFEEIAKGLEIILEICLKQIRN